MEQKSPRSGGLSLFSLPSVLIYGKIVNKGRPRNYESPHGHRHRDGGRPTSWSTDWGLRWFGILHFHLDRCFQS